MRISDWSSDVCSSDLRQRRAWPERRDQASISRLLGLLGFGHVERREVPDGAPRPRPHTGAGSIRGRRVVLRAPRRAWRSEGRRVWHGGGSTGRSGWLPYQSKIENKEITKHTQ